MRTVRDLVEDLTDLVNENPKISKMPIVYSSDDEGNNMQKVLFSPCLGIAKTLEDRDLVITSIGEDAKEKGNCVIIN